MSEQSNFLSCNGNIDKLDGETKRIYHKYNIPSLIEENWINGIKNMEIEEKQKKDLINTKK